MHSSVELSIVVNLYCAATSLLRDQLSDDSVQHAPDRTWLKDRTLGESQDRDNTSMFAFHCPLPMQL